MGNNTSSSSSNSFSHAFLPGLILGLIVGAVAGTLLPEALSRPKITQQPRGTTPRVVEPQGEPEYDEETQKAIDEAMAGVEDDAQNGADDIDDAVDALEEEAGDIEVPAVP